MDLHQASSSGENGGVSGVDDHRVLDNIKTPFTNKEKPLL